MSIHKSSTVSYFFVESSRTFECYIGHETIHCMANALPRVRSPSPLTGGIPPIIYNKENAFTSVQNIPPGFSISFLGETLHSIYEIIVADSASPGYVWIPRSSLGASHTVCSVASHT